MSSPGLSSTGKCSDAPLVAFPTTTSDPIHTNHLAHALRLARESPPRPTNFRVGAVLVDADANTVVSTGYTLECAGNTHAEECCLIKMARGGGGDGEAQGGEGETRTDTDTDTDTPELAHAGLGYAYDIASVLRKMPARAALYTTMEPCVYRQSGARSCVQRIVEMAGRVCCVYVGVLEPTTFVAQNNGREMLRAAGIQVVKVEGEGLDEREILNVAMAGHGQ